MRKEIDIKNEMATKEGFDNWEQLRKQFITNGLHGTVAAYEARAKKLSCYKKETPFGFLCALSDEGRCKEQCFTCSEDQKCDEIANETGKTPRQLADDNKVLLEALKELLTHALEHDLHGMITHTAQQAIKQVTE